MLLIPKLIEKKKNNSNAHAHPDYVSFIFLVITLFVITIKTVINNDINVGEHITSLNFIIWLEI